jgi:hypothetical protein
MAQIIPYLVGGVTAFLVADIIPLPSPSEQFGALRAGIAAPAPLLGTPASSVNRAAKRDRGVMPNTPMNDVTTVAKNLNNNLPGLTVRHHHNERVVRPAPVEVIPAQPPGDRKPRTRKVPLGCEPSFSPVAAPSLSHHTGRCVADLQAATTFHG